MALQKSPLSEVEVDSMRSLIQVDEAGSTGQENLKDLSQLSLGSLIAE